MEAVYTLLGTLCDTESILQSTVQYCVGLHYSGDIVNGDADRIFGDNVCNAVPL